MAALEMKSIYLDYLKKISLSFSKTGAVSIWLFLDKNNGKHKKKKKKPHRKDLGNAICWKSE